MKRRLPSIAALLILTGCADSAPSLDELVVGDGRIDATAPPSDAGPTDAADGLDDAAGDTTQVLECPLGFAPRGARCELSVPLEPRFGSDGAWVTFGGATVDGELSLDRDAICRPGGSGARQTVALDTFEEAGPIRVSVDLRYDLCDNPGVFPCEPASNLFFRIGESVFQVQTPFGLPEPERTVSFCLPSSAYGRGETLEVWAREFDETACSDTDTRTLVEAIEAVRFEETDDDTCPGPSDLDGTFDADFAGTRPDNWFIDSGGTGSVQVVGDDVDNDVRLSLTTGCSNAQMNQLARAPAPTTPGSGVGLEFDLELVEGTPLQVRFGPLERYVRTQPDGRAKICLPSFLWGRAEGLLFRVTGSIDCAEEHDYSAVIDDVEFVEDPECGPAGQLRDEAFEAPFLVGWNASSGGEASVEKTVDGVRLQTTASCSAASVGQWLTPRDGPMALSFDYRATPTGDHVVRLRELGRNSFPTVPLAPAAEWTAASVCLPPEPRVPLNVSIATSTDPLACDEPASGSVELRTVSVLPDPSCAAGVNE